jgi:PilZ domain
MGNNNGRFNIYGVNSFLFQIISHMSETERRKLKAVLMPKANNGKDLSSLIASLPEAKRCELLEKLTNWYLSRYSELRGYSEYEELREYPRKRLSTPVELSKNGFTFLCLTQNMSNSGVFIQTDFSFQINQQITMILTPPKIAKDITVGGRIVRLDPKGIGVKFDEPMPDFPHIFS